MPKVTAMLHLWMYIPYLCLLISRIMNETGLFESIREGDLASYEAMFLTYYSPLCEYASQFVAEYDAEELVQELMTHIWEAREQLVIVTSLKSYLFIAVKNRSLNAIRKQRYRERVHSRLHDYLTEQQIDDPDFYLANELGDRIHNAIQELPESYRVTFEMSRLEGMTNAQIAAALQVSVKTVEYRITRSLKRLREQLKDYASLLVMLF